MVASHRVLNLDSLDEIDDEVDTSKEPIQSDKPNEALLQKDDSNNPTCKTFNKNTYSQKQIISECKDDRKDSEKYNVENNRTNGKDGDSVTDVESSVKTCEKFSFKRDNESSSSGAEVCSETGQKMFCLLDVESEMPTYQSLVSLAL